jgi:hypothetical protein
MQDDRHIWLDTSAKSVFRIAWASGSGATGGVGLPSPGRYPDLAPFDQDLMYARRSALIVAASVVGMPCGKPL